MSSMLEQAIVDATALREAALKNAEQAIIEKYAPQIKDAVESLLEGNDTGIGVGSYVRHLESNQIGRVHAIDEDGVQVEGRDGKAFLAEMDQLEEAEMLHEEEMGGMGSMATSAGVSGSGGLMYPITSSMSPPRNKKPATTIKITNIAALVLSIPFFLSLLIF